VPFDRFILEMALDRNFSIFEILLIVFIATLISYLSSPLQTVYSGLIQTVVMSFAIASSHFSLLKAPQPDAHSPVHHNPLVTYSRAFYFITLSIAAIIANQISVATMSTSLYVTLSLSYFYLVSNTYLFFKYSNFWNTI